MKTIRLTTGTYSCSDFKVLKNYKSEKCALKHIRRIGYIHSEIFGTSWTFQGTNYNLSIQS